MKFKMAPNSLFAILLRSPWWISMGMALLFFVFAHMVLPQNLRLVGMAGGLPFLGLGLLAGWRQWRAPSARRVEAVQQAVAAMSWPEFARTLERGFQKQGYVVETLSGPADLLLRRDGRHTLVSARRWKAARHGEDALQALHQARRARDASGCVYVALAELTPQAQRFADQHRVEVLQGPALAQLLRGVPLPSA